MNTTTPISETEYEKIQIGLFKEALNFVLGFITSPKIEYSDKLVRSAKVNTPHSLRETQLLNLLSLAQSWNQSLTIETYGPGLTINFNQKTN